MIKKLMAALAVAATLLFGATPPAATATPMALTPAVVAPLSVQASAIARAQADCQNYRGTVCLFAHANYGNPIWRQYPDQINGCRTLVGTGWNDVTTVAWNNTPGHYKLRMWKNAPCGGSGNQYYDLPSDTVIDFSGTNMDNAVTQVQIIAY